MVLHSPAPRICNHVYTYLRVSELYILCRKDRCIIMYSPCDWYGSAVESLYKSKHTVRNNVKMLAHFILNFMFFMEDVSTSRHIMEDLDLQNLFVFVVLW